MIIAIQIVALLQGFFVVFVLFTNRKDYKRTTFWLLFGSLLSVLLCIIGDDQNNMFIKNTDWFLFDNSLFVTFLFLFFRYYQSGKEKFEQLDYLFFLPSILYFILEVIEIILVEENIILEIFEILIELNFVIYLLFIAYSIFARKRKHWIIYFTLPIVILFVLCFINDVFKLLGVSELPLFNEQNFNTYLLLVVAFLFYFVAFNMLIKGKEILP